MKRSFLWALVLVLTSIGYAQAQRTITGTVTDSSTGEPVPFASVVVLGTTIGVTADEQGNYSINSSETARTLRFTSVGYDELDIEINERTIINVELIPSASQLDQVIVLGYGLRKPGEVTGAISTIRSEKLQKPVANISQMLQGQAAGVYAISSSGHPGAGATVRIRGNSSINASNTPLYVVDGVPVSSTAFQTISSSDIASITTLKDAAATSMYGSRGSNGVILVTTKSGIKGETKVTFRAEMGVSILQKPTYDLMNTQQKLQYEIEAGLIDMSTAAGQAEYNEKSQYDFDQFDEFFRNAKIQTYDLSLQGGDETTDFYASLNYFQQDGIVERSDFERIVGRINVNHRAKKWLRFGTNTTFGYQTGNYAVTPDLAGYGNNVFNPVNAATRVNSYERIRDENGDFLPMLKWYGYANPLSEMAMNEDKQTRYFFRTSSYLEVEFIKDLKLRTVAAVDINETKWKYYLNPESVWGAPMNGRAGRSSSMSPSFQWTNQLSYKKTFNEKHTIGLSAITEMLKEKTDFFRVYAQNVSHDLFKELSQFQDIYPQGWSGTLTEHNMMSYLLLANYDFDGKYYFDASFRTDGDSSFGKNNRWGTFWSVAASWNIHKEDFMQNITWIDMLKLRGSVGTTGNSPLGLSAYASRGQYSFSSRYNDRPGSSPSTPANDDLTWEKQLTYNIGIDLTAWNNRVNFTAEWYRKNTSDLLFQVPVTLTSGFAEAWRNTGELHNTGFEFTVGVDVVRTRDFTFNIDANISLNTNKIDKLYGDIDIIDRHGSLTTQRVGYNSTTYLAPRWAGVNSATGNGMWYDAEGNVRDELNDAYAVPLNKNYSVDKTAGATINLAYKGISLSALFVTIWDRYMVNNNLYFIELDNGTFAGTNHTVESLDHWQKPGDISERPRVGAPSGFDSRIIQNSSFLRLKSLTLNYSFEQGLLKHTKVIKGARVYAIAQNLFTWTKYRGYDVENPSNIDLGNYPGSRVFTFGLELIF